MPLLLALSAALAAEPTPLPADEAPKACWNCDAWNAPRAPFRLWGDAWFVGPDGLSSVVVSTAEGLVLLDGALPQSVEGIVANLATLGLDIDDVRYILTSHAHYDHVGGVAALQRRSGATVLTSAEALPVLRSGRIAADDPQAAVGAEEMAFPRVTGPIETVASGESRTLGGVRFTALATPGHTPGGLSWSWQSCVGDTCVDLVYADSLNPVSADGYRFSDHPERLADFRGAIDRVAALPCHVLVAVHPGFTDLYRRADRASRRGPEAMIDPEACRAYAAGAHRRLDRRLRDEARDSAKHD